MSEPIFDIPSPVLVTGATGFVGRQLCGQLRQQGVAVLEGVRAEGENPPPSFRIIGDLKEGGAETLFDQAVQNTGAVVHLAARVHVMKETEAEGEALFENTNAIATERLARAAARAGLRRFIYLSTIKVNGESNRAGRPFSPDDTPTPGDPYARSKADAEARLRRVEAETGLAVTILRPPLVYGPGVGGNFLKLMNSIWRRLPLPLGAIENQRSLVYVGNLADAIAHCLSRPETRGKTYLVCDGQALSSPELVRRLSGCLGLKPRLLSVPPALLHFAGGLLGKKGAIDRLTGSLLVDGSSLESTGWRPPYSVAQGLEATCRWYLEKKMMAPLRVVSAPAPS